MHKVRIALSRGNRFRMSAGPSVLYAGIVCCAAAIVLVLAVAIRSAT